MSRFPTTLPASSKNPVVSSMTGPENERLAVLESQFRGLQLDVSEIKIDVKSLVQAQSDLTHAFSVMQSVEFSARQARGSTGVWVRAILPWVVAVAALVMSGFNIFARLVAQ